VCPLCIFTFRIDFWHSETAQVHRSLDMANMSQILPFRTHLETPGKRVFLLSRFMTFWTGPSAPFPKYDTNVANIIFSDSPRNNPANVSLNFDLLSRFMALSTAQVHHSRNMTHSQGQNTEGNRYFRVLLAGSRKVIFATCVPYLENGARALVESAINRLRRAKHTRNTFPGCF